VIDWCCVYSLCESRPQPGAALADCAPSLVGVQGMTLGRACRVSLSEKALAFTGRVSEPNLAVDHLSSAGTRVLTWRHLPAQLPE
jgi:hypothetical protein